MHTQYLVDPCVNVVSDGYLLNAVTTSGNLIVLNILDSGLATVLYCFRDDKILEREGIMKKLGIILLILVLLVGCSNNENNNAKNDNNNQIADVDVSKDKVEITTEDGSTLDISTDLDESVPIPGNYPKDIFPVYTDAQIAAASENADGSFLLMGMTNDSMEEIVEFYKAALEGAVTTMVSSIEDTYLNMGTLNGYIYTVSITTSMEDLGYKHSFSLIVSPEPEGFDDGSDDNDVDDADNADVDDAEDDDSVTMPDGFVLPETISWPADFPKDVLPIYTDAYVEAKAAMEQGEETMVALMTEEATDIIIGYYDKLFEDAIGYTKTSMEGTTMLSGTVDGQLLMVMILENDGSLGEDERFKTLIQIVY